MKVLVSVASRHGASFEIAEEISATLAASGFATAVLPPDAVTSLEGYDAVILGSSVYLGHWMDSRLEPRGALLDGDHGRTGLALLERSDRPRADARGRAGRRRRDLVAATGAREHRVFAGQVDRSRLGLGEKVILTAVRAPEGDFRPWDDIRAWAGEIAAALKAAVAGATPGLATMCG